MIETAGGNAAVVEDGDMRAERMACSVGVWNTCAGGGLRGPLEAGILVQVESTGQVETLVPAAKVAQLDACAKSLVDAGEEKAVPGGGVAVADVPEPQIDVHVRACSEGCLAEVDDVLQVFFRCVAVEFCVGVRREVHLAYRRALQQGAARAGDGGAVRDKRKLERRRLELFDVMDESRVERGFAKHMEVDVLGADALCARKALFKKCRRHVAVGRARRGGVLEIACAVALAARTKTATQVAGVGDFDVDAVQGLPPARPGYLPCAALSARMALPRWLMAFFSSSSIWAKVRSNPSGTNSGS